MIRIAFKSEPDNVAYIDSMGWVLFKLGRLEEARTYLQKAVATPGGSDGTIWEHLGDCEEGLKHHDKAVEAWKKGVERRPGRVLSGNQIDRAAQGETQKAAPTGIRK